MSAKPSQVIDLLLLSLILCTLAQLLMVPIFSDSDIQIGLGWGTRVLFFGLCLFCMRISSVREWSLFAISLGLIGLAVRQEDWLEILRSGFDLAVFLGTFIALVTFMKEAAIRSNAVTKAGVYLTSQPPGRRFYSIAFGSHIMGAMLNFGAVSLMAPLVQSGAKNTPFGDPKELEQRQMSALVRGFSWILLWAPTTLTQAVLLHLFADVDYPKLLGLGLSTAVLMIVIGFLLDRFDWGHPLVQEGNTLQPLPKEAVREVLAIVAALLAGTSSIMALTGFTVAEALMLVAPTVTLVWLSVQIRSLEKRTKGKKSTETISQIFSASVPALTRSAVALGLSGFIGRLCANLLPVEDIAIWINSVGFSPWVFLCLLPIIITIGGQIALSPILFVVFLGEILAALPTLPADPTLIVFALSIGWALSMAASPNATATLLISAASNIPPTTLTWRWNSKYALICYLVCTGIFYLLTR